MDNSLYQSQPPPLLTHLSSSKWYVYAVLCRSSGSGRLPGTNRWFWAPSTTAFSTVEFSKKPMMSRKEFCAMDVVSFLPNQAENWQRKPDFQISIGIESSFLLCNFVGTNILRSLFLYYCVVFLHICIASASGNEIGDCLVPKGPPHYIWFYVFFSSLSRQASVGYC